MAIATSRITSASARFMNALVAMEPETEDSGIYADKPGYHGTRAENDARTGTSTPDYSCRAPLDRLGPPDKGAGYDWTHRKAQRGDYSSMAKYGDRLEAAFNARDPRLYGWREALGQTDLDKAAEGLDFDGWFTRVPDSTHEWHWHLSEHRAFVESWDNKLCMLSVLKGEALEAYLAAGGVLMKEVTPMGLAEDLLQDVIPNRPWRGDFATNPQVRYSFYVSDMWDRVHNAEVAAGNAATQASAAASQSKANGSTLSSLTAALARVEGKVDGLADVPVTLTDEDRDAIAELVAAKVLAKLTALQFVGQPATPTV